MSRPIQQPAATFALGETGGREAAIHRFSHEAMATVFEVRCAGVDAGYAAQAAHAAFELVDRLEQDLSRFVGNSDIARINALAAAGSTRVSLSTMECLEVARRMYDVTGGAFDVSIGSGLEGLELVPDELTVHSRAGGVRVDLGGIGKGYAVDRVVELLEEWGVTRALVHGGFSSVRATGAPPDLDGWRLTLSAPAARADGGETPGAAPVVLAQLTAAREALSASGTRKGLHIVDPRDGAAIAGRAAWVALPAEGFGAPATVAEALSTAFMILTPREITALCDGVPGLAAWVFEEPPEGSASPGRLTRFGALRQDAVPGATA